VPDFILLFLLLVYLTLPANQRALSQVGRSLKTLMPSPPVMSVVEAARRWHSA
jgi:hypothetical protein